MTAVEGTVVPGIDLADTDLLIDPEAPRRTLAVGAHDGHAPSHPSAAALRRRVAELEARLGDAQVELEFLRLRATER